MTKTLYRCTNCNKYSLSKENCANCEGSKEHPYPARFSIIKEQKYRPILRKSEKNN